jgi:hypothetical protein
MKDNINILELLKDCPRGMELDCSMFENTYFDKIDDEDCFYQIICYVIDDGVKNIIKFTKYGRFNTMAGAKCVIFPKGKTTWEGFQRPFKDGDIITDPLGTCIFKGESEFEGTVNYYCGIISNDYFHVKDDKCNPSSHYGYIVNYRLATEEEKEKLFKAIKDNGYKWDPEAKVLEKLIEPKFKVGDRIKSVISSSYYTVVDIKNNNYFIQSDSEKYPYQVSFELEINYELVPTKFDINTLVPFESRVLVRDCNCHAWEGEIFTRCTNKSFNNCNFVTLGGQRWKQCIPYNDDTKYLLGTTNDCNDYYKNWK